MTYIAEPVRSHRSLSDSKKVIGVEIVAEAVEAAKENAAANGLTNCEFIAGDVLKVLDDISENRTLSFSIRHAMAFIRKHSVRSSTMVWKILFIFHASRRVLQEIWECSRENGYAMKRMSNVDMFPQTVHVETVCLLSKRSIMSM